MAVLIFEDTERPVFDLSNAKHADFVLGFKNRKHFVAIFRKAFGFVLAYHATRMDNAEIRGLAEYGLKVAHSSLMVKKANSRFIYNTDDQILKNAIGNEINRFYAEPGHITFGSLNFSLEKDPLQENAYQYLFFGPESMLPLADQLKKLYEINFRQRMALFGNPIILHVKIPVSYIADCWIANIFEYFHHGAPECCALVRKDIASKNIARIEYVPVPIIPQVIVKYGCAYLCVEHL